MKDIKDKFGVKAIGVNMDVSNEASIQSGTKQVSDHFGEINILVNNAGVNIPKMSQDYSVDELDSILNINLRSAFLCAKTVYPSIKSSGGGKIINISSMTSLFGHDKVAAYTCSKIGQVLRLRLHSQIPSQRRYCIIHPHRRRLRSGK